MTDERAHAEAVRIIRASGFFDTAWYALQVGGLPDATDAVEHYVHNTAATGARPHALFDPAWYLAQHPLAAHSRLDAFAHFLRDAAPAGASGHPFFDAPSYLASNPEAGHHPYGAFGHYLEVGWRSRTRPHPHFHVRPYLRRHPEAAGEPAVVSFLRAAGARLAAALEPLPDWEAAAAAVAQRVRARSSVVIDARGQATPTVRTVESLVRHTADEIEVVVVDAGGDGDAPYVYLALEERFPFVRVIRLQAQQAPEVARNTGFLATSGKLVVFLDGGTLVTRGWLTPLREAVDAGAHAVQPLILRRDGTVRSAGGVFDRSLVPYDVFRGFPGDAPEVAVPARRSWLSASAVAMPASTVAAVRGFGDRFARSFAAADLALRARAAGHGVFQLQPASIVLSPVSEPESAGHYEPAERREFSRQWRNVQEHDDDQTWRAAGYALGRGRRRFAEISGGQPVEWHPIVTPARDAGTDRLRWAIKIAAPDVTVRDGWGDYHFALALKRALERLGQQVAVDCRHAWYRDTAELDDVVLVLRGLGEYAPRPDHANLLWVLSHPDLVTVEEADLYDQVFVASEVFAGTLAQGATTPVEVLLQATDPSKFMPGPQDGPRHPVLFVGNSRHRSRPMVQAAVAAGLDLAVYGLGWDGVIPAKYVKGDRVDNDELPSYYRSADVVLCDHWPDMRRLGFISNRVFDAVACAAHVVSDEVPGMHALFGDAVVVHAPGGDLAANVQSVLSRPDEGTDARREAALRISREHSFHARAMQLVAAARSVCAARV